MVRRGSTVRVRQRAYWLFQGFLPTPLMPTGAPCERGANRLLECGQAPVEVAHLRYDRDPALDLDGAAVDVDPSIVTCPALGRTRVVIAPIVVVLPAPFGPSRPKIWPSRASNSMPATASGPLGAVALAQPVDTDHRGRCRRDRLRRATGSHRRRVYHGCATVARSLAYGGCASPTRHRLRKRSLISSRSSSAVCAAVRRRRRCRRSRASSCRSRRSGC